MTPTTDVQIAMLDQLRSIDATLKELLLLSKSKRAAVAAAVPPTSPIATDAELDSEYGDEPVKFKPKAWTGDFTKGQRMSECSPEFLDQLAAAHDYFATKNAADPTRAGYEVRSARRARGFAARLRAGWKPKAVETMSADSVQW